MTSVKTGKKRFKKRKRGDKEKERRLREVGLSGVKAPSVCEEPCRKEGEAEGEKRK